MTNELGEIKRLLEVFTKMTAAVPGVQRLIVQHNVERLFCLLERMDRRLTKLEEDGNGKRKG